MARDKFHNEVRVALEKEGWTITHDPFKLMIGQRRGYIDLGSEIIGAEKDNQKIAIEIKSFIGVSATTEFSTALGQFLKYQLALEEEQPDCILYLAIPLDAERSFFTLELPRRLVEKYGVNLIVYEPEEEAIVKWQKQTSIDK